MTEMGQDLQQYEVSDAPGNRWITMGNALTRAGHGLTLAEKRIVMCAVSKLDSRRVLPPGEVPTTRITAMEYSETFGVDPDTAYNQLQDGAKHLYQRSIQFYEPAFKRNGKPIEPTLVTMRWVGQVHYQKKEGWVELYWWPKLLPSLTGIKKQFTTYQLQQASALRSVYSWKLLELLMRFKDSGHAQYTIEDFCVSMEATEKQRSDFNNIRRRMIEPAIKELQEKDGWLIQWIPIKAGRRVAALRFDFMRSPQGRLELDDSDAAPMD
jgi:plasmid replication initiation protein